MMRVAALGALALAIVACGSSDKDDKPDGGAGTIEGGVSIAELSVEAYRVTLGTFPDHPEVQRRRTEIGTALAAAGADVVCINTAWGKVNQDSLIGAAKARYPHVVQFMMDLNTKVDDPTDQTGKIPPEPTTPPCPVETHTKLDAAYACLIKNCSTKPDSPEGAFTDYQCYQRSCLAEGLDVISNYPRCGSCAAAYFEDKASYAEGRKQCTTNPRAGLGANGDGGNVILSRYPIKTSQNYVLPSTRFRRNVLRAEIDVGEGRSVDVYCTQLTPPFDNITLPYVGDYGAGKTDVNGWVAENAIQTQKLLAFVESKSSGRALIAGDFEQTQENKVGDTIVTHKALTTPALDVLLAKWIIAAPDGYVPACTWCPDHPWHPDTLPYWSDLILLKGADRSLVKGASVTRREKLFTDGGGTLVPLSSAYGYQATIKL